jgi:hypothetical protein
MTKTKQTATKQYEVQTVAAAEAVLRDLEAKRGKLLALGQQLAERRKAHSYAAHAAQDADAERELTNVAATIAMKDSMLASIAEAISEAQTKLTIARAYEADVADQAKAKQILELLGAFKEAGHELDDALRTLSETGRLFVGMVSQLRGFGVGPSYEQVDVLGGQAVLTALLGTVWGKRFPRLAPREHRSFRTLVDGWVAGPEARISAQLGEQKDEAA